MYLGRSARSAPGHLREHHRFERGAARVSALALATSARTGRWRIGLVGIRAALCVVVAPAVVDLDQLAEAFRATLRAPGALAAAVAAYALACWLRAMAWRLLLPRGTEGKPPPSAGSLFS